MILVLRTPWRYPDKLVARVLAWLVKICEGQETTKPAMPPEIAEYAAAAAAYDKAWEAYRGLDDKAAEEAHDRAMERLNKAEKVIEEKPTRTEWDAFGKWLFLARMVTGGTTPRDEYWIKWSREWADALGAPEAIAAMENVG